MTVESTYLAAFLVGLLGGVHCVGMCGGIVGALSLGLPAPERGRPRAALPFLLAYNAGRLVSYSAAGALLGGVGLLAAGMTALHDVRLALQLIAGLFMVVLGLYLAGWWSGLLRLERAGGLLWRRIEPLARRLLPVRTLPQAFALGLVWGWLPCGMVYSVLIWATAAGGPVQGALLLLSFGLGTLPNLLAMGLFATRLGRLLQQPRVRQGAGLLVAGLGIWTALRSFL